MTSTKDNVIEIQEAPKIDNLKILLCGDVGGKFDKLFKKVASLNASAAGPFDYLFCVGNFFEKPKGSHLADESKAIAQHQLLEYIQGFKQVPIPTYFIAGPDEDKYLPGTREELCPNLFYLGKFGIATLKGDLKLAYVSGRFGNNQNESSSFLRSGFDSLVATWASDVKRGTDILLTNEWPSKILTLVDKSLQPKSPVGRPFDKVGVDGVQLVVKSLKPRYHFAGVENQFFARTPYVNRTSLTDFSRSHVTRFVALANCFNPEKQKYIFAINVVPVEQMSDETLYERPEDSTDSPFIQDEKVDENVQTTLPTITKDDNLPDAKRPRKAMGTSGFVKEGSTNVQQSNRLAPVNMFNRWGDVNQGGGRGGRGRGRGGRGGRGGRKPLPPVGPCWFCLKSPQVEKHLIIAVGDEAYVAMAKGGIVDDHLLIVAVEHSLSYDEMLPSAKSQVDKYKESLKKFFARDGREAVFFERFLIVRNTCHMHIQAVPLPAGSSQRAHDAWISMAQEKNMKFSEEPIETNDQPYFRVELNDGTIMTHMIDTNKRFDLQFGRRVCAQLLNMPDRVDWKACAPSKEEETKIAKRLRKQFAPFDWAAEEDDDL